MDRVLLVFDHIQFSGHLENTLRKVGYITDTLQSEYNLSERVLTFNPDIIVTRGTSARLVTGNVGRKLKDTVRFSGKVILIFSEESVPDEAQLKKMKYDIILEEPASALKIAANILNLEQIDKTAMKEKLHKMIVEDAAFRAEEMDYLVQYGRTIEQELISVRALEHKGYTSDDLKQLNLKLKQEMQGNASRARAKIESYNQQIDKLNVDLKRSLNKKDTRVDNKESRKNWEISDSKKTQELDVQRKEFVVELFKKDKE